MSSLSFWNGSAYVEVPILPYVHTEYLEKTGGTTSGNLDIWGLRSGRIYGGRYYGVESTALGSALLLGSDYGENQIWYIGAANSEMYLRPNSNENQETIVYRDGVIAAASEVSSDLHYGHAQLRCAQGNWAMMFRNDGASLYFLSSDYTYDAAHAGWNSTRPLTMSIDNGEIYVGHDAGFIVGVEGKIHSRHVADNTSTGGNNIYVANTQAWPTWYMARSTSSLSNKFSIADINGGEVPDIPYARRKSSRVNTPDVVPDYHDLLDTAVVAFRMDETEDTGTHLGYVVENLKETANWCIGDDPEDIDLGAVVAGNLALLKDLDTQILELESRIAVLEGASSG